MPLLFNENSSLQALNASRACFLTNRVRINAEMTLSLLYNRDRYSEIQFVTEEGA